MLEIKNLSATVNSLKIIKEIRLNVKPGEIHLMMGPNGAGKSTLAKAIVGWHSLQCEGEINIDGSSCIDMPIDERARLGLFYGNQHPVEVPGVHILDFLRTSYNNITGEMIDPWSFQDIFDVYSNQLGLPSNLYERNLNEGFSGGEKKKTEILQMLILKPKYAVLDEIDSGIDLESLKVIFKEISLFARDNKTGILIISHNPKILDYIKPDFVHLLKAGKLEETGGLELAERIISEGYVTKNGK